MGKILKSFLWDSCIVYSDSGDFQTIIFHSFWGEFFWVSDKTWHAFWQVFGEFLKKFLQLLWRFVLNFSQELRSFWRECLRDFRWASENSAQFLRRFSESISFKISNKVFLRVSIKIFNIVSSQFLLEILQSFWVDFI